MKNNFKIRCSAIGQIMPNAKSAGELSKTAQSYCQTWAKEIIYGRRKEIHSKYMTKGIDVEESAIEFISDKLNLGMVFKNETFFENEYITGTPDLILPDEVIDVKASWDAFTFPLFDSDLQNSDYYYQLQGYMELTGKKKGRIIYVLMDTPEELIERELKSFFFGADEWDTDKEKEIREKHSYHNVPVKYRIKEFTVYRDEEVISRINQRVIECRNYLNTI
jgi:hypothetical protein